MATWGSLAEPIPSIWQNVVIPPGFPGGAGGPGGGPAPSLNAGYELYVRTAPGFNQLAAIIPRFMSMSFSKVLNDKGAGTVVFNLDDVFWQDATIAVPAPAAPFVAATVTGTTATSQTAPVSSTSPPGNALTVIAALSGSSTPVSCSDSQGNPYFCVPGQLLSSNPYFQSGTGNGAQGSLTGWAPTGCSATIVPSSTGAVLPQGAPTLFGVLLQCTSGFGITFNATTPFTAAVSTSYLVTALVYSPVAATIAIGCLWELSGVGAGASLNNVSVGAGWTCIGTVVTSPGSGINQGLPQILVTAAVPGQQLTVLAFAVQTPQVLQMFQALSASQLTAGSDSVTVAFSAAPSNSEVMVLSTDNVLAQGAVDISLRTAGTSASPGPGSATPLQAGEVALLAVSDASAGGSPQMAALVPYGVSTTGDASPATSLAITLGAQINKGDLCIVEIGTVSPATVTNISSTSISSASWQIVTLTNGTRPVTIAYAYAPVNLVSGTETITVTISSSQVMGLVVFGLPNDGSGVYLDQSAGQAVSSANASITTSSALQRSNECVIGFACVPNALGAPSSSFTSIATEHVTGQVYVAAWYQDVTTSAAPTFTASTTGSGWDAGVATFYRGWQFLAQLAPGGQPLLTLWYCLVSQAATLNPQVSITSAAWTSMILSLMGLASPPAYDIFNSEQLWQVYYNGFPVFDFLGETETFQQVDPSEQTDVTVTGPGTIAALAWGAAMPPGFPDIVFKTDAIQDGFAEINAAGALTVDTAIWNVLSPAADVQLNPAGTLQIMASAGTTFAGATPYDLTNSLFSAQVVPLGQSIANASGSAGFTAPVLDGSQVTQMYFQSNANSTNYILIGVTASGLYFKFGDAVKGAQVKQIGQYNPSTHAFWQISHAYTDNGALSAIQWWTSADGVNWTLQWEVNNPSWQPTNGTVFFSAAYDVNNSQFMQVTNVNGNVVTPSSSGNVYFGEPIMAVWYSIYQQAQQRGTISFITTALNGSQDSFGNQWSDSQSVQIQNGTDLYSLLQSHAAIVNADYVMQPGFLLQVGLPVEQGKSVNGPVSLGFDRSASVIVREAGAQTSKQHTKDRSQIANLVGAVNADGTTISASSESSGITWGQREGWLQTAVQVNPQSILEAAQASVLQTKDEILSYTVNINPNWPGAQPWVNFNVGDWIGLEVPGLPAPVWQELWTGDGSTAAPSIQVLHVPAIAGENYTFQALVYSPQGWSNGCYFFVNWRNGSGTLLGTASQSTGAVPIPAGDTNGTMVTFANVQAPAGTATADIFLSARGTPASSVQFYAAAGIQVLPNLTAIANLNWTGANGATEIQTSPWAPGLSVWANSTVEVVRVMAIAINIDASNAVTCELTLVTYRQWLEEQLQYLVSKLGGQFINSLGTSPVTSSASGPTSLPGITNPSPPGLQLSNNAALLHGVPLIFNSITGQWQTAGSIDPETGASVTTTGPNLQTLHYSTPTPQPGALIASITPVAGADDPGNTYAAGVSVYQGSGFFVYSGQAASGDLIVSAAGSAGQDAYGNTFPQGLQVSQAALISGVLAEFQQVNLDPGPLLLYGDINQVITVLTGSGNWIAPAGVTSVQVLAQGAGGGNNTSQGGGGGAEYAQNNTVAVTPLGSYAYSAPAGTTGAGGNATFTGDSVTVTAHGGGAGPGGAGGSGSTAPVHYSGGRGSNVILSGTGGGGGGAAGSGGPGAAGRSGGGGGAGGGGLWSGGSGGTGGASGTHGQAGATVGGGAGGNGTGNSTGEVGGDARVVLVYTTSTPPLPLLASIAGATGTDPVSGGSYQAGVSTYDPVFGAIVQLFRGFLHWKVIPTFTVDAIAFANQQGAGAPAYPGPYWTVTSPQQTGSTGQSALTLMGGNTAGTRAWQALISGGATLPQTTASLEVQGPAALGQSSSLLSTFSTDAAGYPTVTSQAGAFARIAGSTGLATVNTNTVTQAAFTNLSQAGIITSSTDVQVGSTWVFKVFGYGTWGSTQQALTFGARFGAAATNTVGSTPSINATALAASAAFLWDVEITFTCVTTGVSGTWRVSMKGTVTETANALLPGTAADNTIPFVGGTGSTDITLDTTIAETLGLSAKWASTTGAPTISKIQSLLMRVA